MSLLGFGSEFLFQECGFQHLDSNFGFRGIDFRIWVEISVSVVSISRVGLKFRFQEFGFHELARNFDYKGLDYTMLLDMYVSVVPMT